MKKSYMMFMLVIMLGVVLTSCSGTNGNSNANANSDTNVNAGANTDTGTDSNTGSDANTPADKEEQPAESKTTKEMIDGMLAKIEQPSLMEMPGDMVEQMYGIDTALLEEYTIMMPMMNVKTNEIAIFKVKDVGDIAAVEEGIKKRAADVQKTFETYLPDQYENAKNYKLVTMGSYVFFVISESADQLVAEFDALFEQN